MGERGTPVAQVTTMRTTMLVQLLLVVALMACAHALVAPLNEAVRLELESTEPTVASIARPAPPPTTRWHQERLHHLLGLVEKPPAISPVRPFEPFQGRLLGTLTSSRVGHSVASLLLPSGRAVSAFEGAHVLDATILHIDRNHITLRRGEKEELLFLNTSVPSLPGLPRPLARALSATEFSVSRAQVLGRLSNLMQLSSEVRVVPAFKDGQAIGFRIFAARPGWAPGELGVQSGDVIRAVNGQALESVQRIIELSSQLAQAGSIDLELERGGQRVHHHYRLD
jgi:general secretion pathway protein C